MPKLPKLYRWLLKLYPAGFRDEYEAPMERQFLDDYRDAASNCQRTQLWARTVLDVIISAPAETASEFRADLKHGIRAHRGRAFSIALAIVALGLAIGASTGIFSVLSALLLRRLPFSNPWQLTEIRNTSFNAIQGRPAFIDWYRHSSYLKEAATFSASEMNLEQTRDAYRVDVAETSANFFRLLGVHAIVGRTFAPDEDISGHDDLAVISYPLWQQLFAGDPAVTGKSVRISGKQLTIIGVAPARFDYPGKTNIWLPTVFDVEKVPKRGAVFFQTIGRLGPGIDMQTAQQMFKADVLHANPQAYRRFPGEQNQPRLVGIRDQLAGPVRRQVWVLAGMVFFVLLTACGNVAQLILSRATERRQELAVRAALGASRARLLQQLITEATFLTLSGAAVGLLVAKWTVQLASAIVPARLATQQYTILDWRVITFAITLAVVMGLTFGLANAWLVGRLQPVGTALRVQRGTPEKTTVRVRMGLIAVQGALTLCLVTSSFLLGRAFLKLLHTDLGFRPAGVVTLNVSLQGTKFSGRGEWPYYRKALGRLRALPEVEAAAAVSYLPMADNIYMGGTFQLDSGQSVRMVIINSVTHDYFRAMETRFLAGGDFVNDEQHHEEHSVIVNEIYARNTGLGDKIVGRSVIAPWNKARYRIIGVVEGTRDAGPLSDGGPIIYWYMGEEPPPALTLVAKVRGSAESYLPLIRDVVRTIDPAVPIYDVKTLDQRLAETLARPRFFATATGFLGLLAVLLAAVGVYGTAAYSIAQRRHELGVRLAVGASHQSIRSMILRESMVPVVFGMVTGIVLSIACGRYLQHLLENVSRPAFWSCTSAAMFLLLVGLTAVWTATARILSVDPVESLRLE